MKVHVVFKPDELSQMLVCERQLYFPFQVKLRNRDGIWNIINGTCKLAREKICGVQDVINGAVRALKGIYAARINTSKCQKNQEKRALSWILGHDGGAYNYAIYLFTD